MNLLPSLSNTLFVLMLYNNQLIKVKKNTEHKEEILFYIKYNIERIEECKYKELLVLYRINEIGLRIFIMYNEIGLRI